MEYCVQLSMLPVVEKEICVVFFGEILLCSNAVNCNSMFFFSLKCYLGFAVLLVCVLHTKAAIRSFLSSHLRYALIRIIRLIRTINRIYILYIYSKICSSFFLFALCESKKIVSDK